MSKYVIELDEDVKILQSISVTPNGNAYTNTQWLANLEELNSDYINEHYGSLQDDAYQRGLEVGKQTAVGAAELREKLEYQRGLNDAWKAVRKIVLNPDKGGASLQDMYAIFGNNASMLHICRSYSAYEVIEKFKAYEEKQSDKIEVGDEVNWLGDCFIVTRIFQPRTQKEQCDGIDDDGCVYHDVLMNDLEKTGRHFDIHKILKEMKE